MAHIDNEFNKRFGNQQLPNDDFDTEGLWDAISDDLDAGEATPGGDILPKKWIFGLSVLLIVSGILGIIYFKSNNDVITQKTENHLSQNIENTPQNDAVVSPSNSEKDIPLNIQKNIEPTNLNTSQNDVVISPSNSEANIPANIQTNTTSIISQENEFEKTSHMKYTSTSEVHKTLYSNNNTQKTTPSKYTSFTENAPTLPTDLTNKTKLSNAPLISTNNSNKTLINNEIKTNSTNNPIEPSTKTLVDNPTKDSPTTSTENSIEVSVTSLPPIIALVETNTSKSPAIAVSKTTEIPENKQLKTRQSLPIKWQADIFGGINTFHTKHQSANYNDLAELKNSTSKQDLGASYGINAGMVFKDRWLLNSGVEYHQLWSKFDYEKVEQFQVLKEDVLLRVWIDEATGDTLNTLYGDTLVNATSTRTVLHHNQFQRISIPLEIGIQQNSGKLIYGIAAGTVFNLTTKQSGRTLDALGKIVNFNENDTTAPYKPFSIGWRVSPLVGYQLSENWSIILRPQWTLNQNNNFNGTDIQTDFHQINLSVGLKYSFE